ncbi:MAG: hypothetical protein ACK4GG_09260, partial [Sphingomonas sp.]
AAIHSSWDLLEIPASKCGLVPGSVTQWPEAPISQSDDETSPAFLERLGIDRKAAPDSCPRLLLAA